MTQQEVNNTPTTIVAFDASYMLVAIFKSISEAATLTGAIRQSLIKAAYGDIISVNKRYWRVVPLIFRSSLMMSANLRSLSSMPKSVKTVRFMELAKC